jgi:hemoglobin/transferrin/lactoferrin receptor protein
MKKLYALVPLLMVPILFFAQTITIKDQETLQPLESVTLSSTQPEAFATTNSQGQVDITPFIGADSIIVRSLGYAIQVLSYEQLIKSESLFLVATDVTIDRVVVTASRWQQTQRDVPNKVTAIGSKTTALQQPQTTADLLALSGEVFIQKSQYGGGSPMIRGFATNRLLITIDGVRMNTAIFRSGNVQNLISLDAFATERTEVLFGPGSVNYGSDAIAGVMSFYTLTPKLSTTDNPLVTGGATARYSSAANEMTGHFDLGVGWKKFAMLTSFTYSNFGDLRMGSNGTDEYLRNEYVIRMDSMDRVVTNDDPMVQRKTGYSQINLLQKLRYKPSDKWELGYTFQYSTTSSYNRYDRLLRYRNGLPRSAEWYYGPQEWMMNLLSVTHTGNNAAYDQLTIRLAHQRFAESRHDRDFNKPTLLNRYEEVLALSANVDFVKSIGQKQKLFYGIEGIFNDVTSTGTDENIATGDVAIGPARYPKSTWQSYAVYANYQYKPIQKLTLAAGVRYNHYILDATFDTTFYPFPFTTANISKGAVSGSVGAVYNPTQKWTISLNFSTGFRSPNVDDLGKVFDSEPGSVVVPNPSLNTEYAYNFEVGAAKVFGDFLEADATAFYTILDNALVRRDYTLNGMDSIVYAGELSQVQAVQNAAFAKVYGVQAGFRLKLPKGFGLSSRINWQKGEEELDNGDVAPLRHAAPLFGITHLTFTAKRINLDLYAMYNSEVSFANMAPEEQGKDYLYAKDKDGNPYSPAWYTLNFKASYQITDYLGVTAGVENLTDVRYRPYSSGLVAAGRNFILSLRANF